MTFFDPHESSIEKILEHIPPHRTDGIIYFIEISRNKCGTPRHDVERMIGEFYGNGVE